jgi:hypothetical protein
MKCAYCDHDEKDHCKGGVSHSAYKDEMRMTRHARVHVCTTRHCLATLCCCTDYVEV